MTFAAEGILGGFRQPMASANGSSGNSLLDALLSECSPTLSMKRISLPKGPIKTSQSDEFCYFPRPHTLLALFSAHPRRPVEFARVGQSSSTWWRNLERLGQLVVVFPGEGWCIPVRVLEDAARSNSAVARLLADDQKQVTAQIVEQCWAATNLPVSSLVQRWIRTAHEHSGRDILPITHHDLARHLNVRRSGVTVALRILEGDGVLRFRRGMIALRDPPAGATLVSSGATGPVHLTPSASGI